MNSTHDKRKINQSHQAIYKLTSQPSNQRTNYSANQRFVLVADALHDASDVVQYVP